MQSDVAAVVELLGDEVHLLEDRDMGLETASEGRFGYASRHLLIALDPEQAADPAYAGLRDRVASVQVRTVLQHAWAEFEHDIRYKGSIPDEHARDLDRRFTLAAGLLELADQEFTTIRERLRGQPAPDGAGRHRAGSETDDDLEGAEITARELAAFLAGQYEDAEWSRPDHYEWMAQLLDELEITSISRLGEVLRSVDADELMRRMDYRYPPGAVRRLDDALLAAFGDGLCRAAGNGHRTEALQPAPRQAGRLSRRRGECRDGPCRLPWSWCCSPASRSSWSRARCWARGSRCCWTRGWAPTATRCSSTGCR